MYNFVVFSLSRWSIDFGCNIRDISYELSRSHRVLYVDVPLKRKDVWFNRNNSAVLERRKRIQNRNNLVKISDTLWHYIDDTILESVNSISNDKLFDLINRLNGKRFSKMLRKAISEVGFKDYIILNDNDVYNGLYLRNYLNPRLHVYYLRDNLSAMNYWRQHVKRLESKLIRGVDLVFTNSQYLTDYASNFNLNSHYVGQGCDVDIFLKRPADVEIEHALKGIPNPIVGYIGALNSERLDIKLLLDLAIRMSNFNFVLVGQEDMNFQKSGLHKLSNVYFIGKLPIESLPKHLYGFDVALNPQLINEITIGNYPRKVDEYLAAGKPVVGTKTHAMEPFKEHTYLAETVQQFEDCIIAALRENNQEKIEARRAFASQHTWEQSVHSMIEVIDNSFVHEKSSR